VAGARSAVGDGLADGACLMAGSKKIRVLVAKPGLDGHDVGAKIVVRALMEAGFEVIYTGLRKSPEQIVGTACDEDVDVLGLSILSGSHLPICRRLKDLLQERGLTDLLWLVGGNIPVQDAGELKALGVDAVFAVGTPTHAVVDFIREKLS
jgi:methylmalonyl-CoA mutase C-terminal domain/subunit